jgi:hypothetical protein
MRAHAGEPASLVVFQDENDVDATTAKDQVDETKSAEPTVSAPLGNRGDIRSDNRYRRLNGRWWYLDRTNRWHLWNGRQWVLQQSGAQQRGAAESLPPIGADEAQRPFGESQPPFASPTFDTWFNAYRGFPTGRARLQTAEAGQVEMGTSEITEGETAETFEMGGLPRSQARGTRAGVGRPKSPGGSWFNAGSPFGIRYGYGSGYGYGGYGFNNPYGYGSRTGSGGAFGYGFGSFGSVGGQTGERLGSLISGPTEEGGRLIGPEAPGIGAPTRLETTVGGTYGKAGAGARNLGESASSGGGD